MVDEATFHDLVADLNYPMVVATTVADGERSGCLVGFTTQCSIKPPRFLVFISKKNHTFGVASRADHIAVHFLSHEHLELSKVFGELTGDEVDKFERVRWHWSETGLPVLDDCPTWFVGRIVDRLDGGDHLGFVLEIVEAEKGERVAPLGFQEVRDMQPGHPA